MTPTEALELLDRATAAVAGTRADHQAIVEALKVLRLALAAEAENAT